MTEEKKPETSEPVLESICLADGSTILLEEKALDEAEAASDAREKERIAALDRELEASMAALFDDDADLDVGDALRDIEEETPEPVPVPAPLPDAGVVKRINPNLLYQPFWQQIEKLLRACEARGVRYYVISGLRSYEEQAALYAQGRKTPGKIVTWAKPGESFHNFGLACDFARDKDMKRDGLQPDWDLEGYRVLAEEAKKLGLESGFYWEKTDAPHVQLRISRNGLELARLRELRAIGGMKAVDHLLDQYRW